MKNLILTDSFAPETLLISDETPEGNEALQLHFEIKTSFAAAATAMVDFSRQLKTMRDKKLYEHIGFDTFEGYVEKAHGIKQRQAYTYIQTYEKLQPKLMADNAEIGITKLALLCGVSAVDREDFIEDNDVASLTVEELKALIEKSKGLSEQVSLLQADNEDGQTKQELLDKEIARLKTELEGKENKISELSEIQEPIDVAAVEIEKINEAVSKKEKELLAQFAKEKADILKDSKQGDKGKNDKAIEKAKADAKAEAEKELRAEFEKKQSALSDSVAAAKAQAETLEKQLKIAGNQNTVKFNIIFSQVQENILACLAIVEDIKSTDSEMADKLMGALKAVCGKLVGG